MSVNRNIEKSLLGRLGSVKIETENKVQIDEASLIRAVAGSSLVIFIFVLLFLISKKLF